MDNAFFGDDELFDEGKVPDLVVDTGTSYCSLHKDALHRVKRNLHHKYGLGKPKLNHEHNWEFHCTQEQYDKVPDLSWKIKGTQYILPKKDWLPRRDHHCML